MTTVDTTLTISISPEGMRWTRAGANRLLKLRLGELDKAVW